MWLQIVQIAAVIGCVLALVVFAKSATLYFHDRALFAARSGLGLESFIKELNARGVRDSIGEFLYKYFQRWQFVRYPLKIDDIVSEIVELDDPQELFDNLSMTFAAQFQVPAPCIVPHSNFMIIDVAKSLEEILSSSGAK